MTRIMIIAGGTWQCPIVKLAKNMGHYVICTNPYPDSPAFQYADAGLLANVLDKEKNLKYARQYLPDAVLTEQSDIAVPTVAYIAQQLGIKGITIEIAARFTNKYIMRELTNQAGFPSPQYALCHSPSEVRKFVKDKGKSIVKPLDSQSSRGCHIIDSDKDIEKYFEDAIQYSNFEKAVVIEEYIDGTEFTVDGLKTEDDYITTAISEKKHYSYNPNVAKKLLFSWTHEEYDYDRLSRLNKEIVQTLGLPFGLTHAEYKFRDGKFYLIEVAARGGGTRISSDIVPIMSGINSNEIYLKILLDEKYEIKVQKQHVCAILGFFDLKPGRVRSISGIEDALKLSGVIDIVLEITAGSETGQAQDDRSRCGYYILYADSTEKLKYLEERILEIIRVEIE